MPESIRDLALDILADAKQDGPDDSTYVISRDYMDRLMRCAGFGRGIEDAEREIDPEGAAKLDAEMAAAMAEGDAGPYSDADRSAIETDGPVPPRSTRC